MKNTYTHLSCEERDKIAFLRAKEVSQNKVAQIIGRSKGTISRELRRNGSPVYEVYLPHKAQERAQHRKRESGKRDRLKNVTTRQYVIDKLKIGWSPEQITGRLSIDYPGLTISHEAIYQFVYNPGIRQKTDLVGYLAWSYQKRRKRGQSKKHRRSHIPSRISIDKRPKHIAKRKQPGHWEIDTVVSRASKVTLAVMTERKSRLVKIAGIRQRSAAELCKAIKRQLGQYPQKMRLTLTYDNGSENTGHERVNKALGTRSYFCNPYHSWEKGCVENAVGLIRRYLPKKTDFATVNKERIKDIETMLNTRPRKCLGYKTPLEIFSRSVALGG
jgi:IS30 family transposase